MGQEAQGVPVGQNQHVKHVNGVDTLYQRLSRMEGKGYQGHQETFEENIYFHYLDCGDGFTRFTQMSNVIKLYILIICKLCHLYFNKFALKIKV